MLNPSQIGWIKKYVSLSKSGQIDLDLGATQKDWKVEDLQRLLASSGIIFGIYGNFIFLRQGSFEQWTNHEKMKVLYFESLLLVYIFHRGKDYNFEKFFEEVQQFFGQSGSEKLDQTWSINRFLGIPRNLEKTIAERTRIPLSFDNEIWVNYLQNSLCYIDITLFDLFLQKKNNFEFRTLRSKKIQLTLSVIIHALQSDGYIDEAEKKMFKLFMASADLTSQEKLEFEMLLSAGVKLQSLQSASKMSELFRKYLFELAIFSVLSDTDFSSKERKMLVQLSNMLNISKSGVASSFEIVERFTFDHEEIVTNLKSKSNYERIFLRLSAKWSKLFLRNKDKLVTEIRESSELVALVKKSMSQTLSDEEKVRVKTQFFDIVKSVPSLAIFMLPGGAFILPFVLKVLPDLLPSAFRDNEIKDNE